MRASPLSSGRTASTDARSPSVTRAAGTPRRSPGRIRRGRRRVAACSSARSPGLRGTRLPSRLRGGARRCENSRTRSCPRLLAAHSPSGGARVASCRRPAESRVQQPALDPRSLRAQRRSSRRRSLPAPPSAQGRRRRCSRRSSGHARRSESRLRRGRRRGHDSARPASSAQGCPERMHRPAWQARPSRRPNGRPRRATPARLRRAGSGSTERMPLRAWPRCGPAPRPSRKVFRSGVSPGGQREERNRSLGILVQVPVVTAAETHQVRPAGISELL